MLNDLSIIKEFDKIIKDETEDYDLKEFLSDQCLYGQTVFTYYTETTSLYDNYKEDCESWLSDLVDETGLNPWEIFQEWDYAVDSIYNKWYIIVAMFEQYCDYLLEGLEQENGKREA